MPIMHKYNPNTYLIFYRLADTILQIDIDPRPLARREVIDAYSNIDRYRSSIERETDLFLSSKSA